MNIGKYRIINILGSGNMGEVYLVEDTAMNKRYAMKIAYKTRDNSFTDALKNECDIMNSLADRRIPYVIEWGENDTLCYMVMEYVEGELLSDYLKQNVPIEESRAIEIIKQINEIVNYLHKQSPAIIFMDLKPSNLIIDANGDIRLFDFGAGIRQSVIGNEFCYLMGTYGYSAPEIGRGESIGTGADIYSMGAMAYYMITGINPALPPYMLDAEQIPENISSDFKRLITDMIREDSRERILNAQELQQRLKEIKPDTFLKRMKSGYIAYYLMLMITAGISGYFVYNCYMTDNRRYEYLMISLVLCFACVLIRKLLDIHYSSRHFIRKRTVNIFYTRKRNVGLFSVRR